MQTKTKTEIEGLIKLFLHDGLPPNIKVVRVRVKENREGHLEADVPARSFLAPTPPEPTEKQKKAMAFQKETIELEEMTIEERRFLAGFSKLDYSLILGYLE